MKSQIKNVLCAIVIAAVSLGAAQYAEAALPVAGGAVVIGGPNPGDWAACKFKCYQRQDGSIGGWAIHKYSTWNSTIRNEITSTVVMNDGMIGMAGSITDSDEFPQYQGWTLFFAVEDNGHDGEIPDRMSDILVLPPNEYPNAQSIYDMLGGVVPPEYVFDVIRGDLKTF